MVVKWMKRSLGWERNGWNEEIKNYKNKNEIMLTMTLMYVTWWRHYAFMFVSR